MGPFGKKKKTIVDYLVNFSPQKFKLSIRKIQGHVIKTYMAKKLVKVCDSISRIIILLSFTI